MAEEGAKSASFVWLLRIEHASKGSVSGNWACELWVGPLMMGRGPSFS